VHGRHLIGCCAFRRTSAPDPARPVRWAAVLFRQLRNPGAAPLTARYQPPSRARF